MRATDCRRRRRCPSRRRSPLPPIPPTTMPSSVMSAARAFARRGELHYSLTFKTIANICYSLSPSLLLQHNKHYHPTEEKRERRSSSSTHHHHHHHHKRTEVTFTVTASTSATSTHTLVASSSTEDTTYDSSSSGGTGMTAVATSSTSAAAAANGDHLPTVQESPEEAGNAAAAAAAPATSAAAQLPSSASLPAIAGLPSKRSGSTPGETRKRRSKGGRRSLAGSPLPKRTKSGEFMASANADRAAPPSVNPYFYYPEPRASAISAAASKRGSFRGGWHQHQQHHHHQAQQPLPDTVLPFNPQDARLIADMHENDDIEEIVKCVCTVREENGLMVQCEVSWNFEVKTLLCELSCFVSIPFQHCLSWQHGLCMGFTAAEQVPVDGYVSGVDVREELSKVFFIFYTVFFHLHYHSFARFASTRRMPSARSAPPTS